jgi:hypothetical protein
MAEPKLRLHMNELSHEGTALFLSQVDACRLLPNALGQITRHLYTSCPGSTIPGTRSVTLVLRCMDGVAYTTGIELDNDHKEIHLSLDYVQKFAKKPQECRHEIVGVVTHEMVHCYQYNGDGTAPGGLIEGIADFVRLKAGLAPPHWRGPKEELGEKWDSGYQKTAYFLSWLEEQHGPGTVGKINETMRAEKYDEATFWENIFGSGNGIDVLWKNYRASLEGEPEESTKTGPSAEQMGLEERTPTSDDMDAKVATHPDSEDDDEEGAVFVEREDHLPLGRGLGGSVRRRPST